MSYISVHYLSVLHPVLKTFPTAKEKSTSIRDGEKTNPMRAYTRLLCLALSGFVQVSFYMGPDHIIMQLRNHLNRHHSSEMKYTGNTPSPHSSRFCCWVAFDVTVEQSAVAQVAQPVAGSRRSTCCCYASITAHSNQYKQHQSTNHKKLLHAFKREIN